jgi:hypothetical protein
MAALAYSLTQSLCHRLRVSQTRVLEMGFELFRNTRTVSPLSQM